MGQYYYNVNKTKQSIIEQKLAKANNYGSNHIFLKMGEDDIYISKENSNYYFSNKILGLFQYLKENPEQEIGYVGDYNDNYEEYNNYYEEETIKVKQTNNNYIKKSLFINENKKEYISVKEFLEDLKSKKEKDLYYFPMQLLLLEIDENNGDLKNDLNYIYQSFINNRFEIENEDEIEYEKVLEKTKEIFNNNIIGKWSFDKLKIDSIKIENKLKQEGYKNITKQINPEIQLKELLKKEIKENYSQEENLSINENGIF